MIAITTSSTTSVKPRAFSFKRERHITLLSRGGRRSRREQTRPLKAIDERKPRRREGFACGCRRTGGVEAGWTARRRPGGERHVTTLTRKEMARQARFALRAQRRVCATQIVALASKLRALQKLKNQTVLLGDCSQGALLSPS